MPTPTYTLIQEQVLGSAAASVTFSSIPGTYKDLVLEITFSAAAGIATNITLNGDTTTNYSITRLYGNGTSATSDRISSASNWNWGNNANSGGMIYHIWQFQSYASTNVFKTALQRITDVAASGGNQYVAANVGLWRKSPAEAITTITSSSGTNYPVGSTFRLWGVAG